MSLGKLDCFSFKKILEEEKSSIGKIEKLTAEAVMESGRLARSVSDNGEKAQVGHDLALNVKLSQDFLGKLKKINSALRRIEKGTFGSCIDCHAQIHQERLESVPWEPQCIVCKKEQEEEDALIPRKAGLGNFFYLPDVGHDDSPEDRKRDRRK